MATTTASTAAKAVGHRCQFAGFAAGGHDPRAERLAHFSPDAEEHNADFGARHAERRLVELSKLAGALDTPGASTPKRYLELAFHPDRERQLERGCRYVHRLC